MKIKFILLAVIAVGALFVAQQASAQDAGLTGRWTGSITTPDGNQMQVTYVFKVEGTKLTGTAESPAGAVSVDNGKVDGKTFLFTVTVDGNDYSHTGKLNGDTCDLDLDLGGTAVHFTIKRDKGK